MSPGNFRPNLSSNRSIRFSNERGISTEPVGEGVLLPKIPRQPAPIAMHTTPPKSIVSPKMKPSGRRYYGEGLKPVKPL